MDAATWKHVEAAFIEALARPQEDRATFLETLRADVRGEVEAMLEAHEGDWRLHLERMLDGPVENDVAENLIGTRIGTYRLIRFIARGGMGEVFVAEREEPFRQTVALKLLRQGVGGADATNRFRLERQILARLTHPHITQILDGGIHQGRPYLVLEYIEGQPLIEYCDTHRLPVPQRLQVFLTVCAAVAFAHRNLVVHRDLKPSNILVTASGNVKLLDFGIAKLLDPLSMDAGTPLTRDDRPMTLDYAAPEQIRGEAITTATDVYALGLLLHELIAGRTPFAADRQSRTELERRICEDSPALPITGHVDLDNIIVMALRKEPERRYASVEQLASDLAHYLANEPVSARPDTLRYRAGKFAQRHTAAVALGLLSLLLVLGFTLITVLQSRELKRERDSARDERRRAEQVVRLLTDLFEGSNPEKLPGGRDLRVGEFLDRSIPLVLSGLRNQPDVQARMKVVLADMHRARSEFPRAKQLAEEALHQFEALEGADSAATVEAFRTVARLTAQMEGPVGALPLLRESLARHQRLFEPGDPRLASAMEDLAQALPASAERLTLLEEALAIRQRVMPRASEDLAATLNLVGVYYLHAKLLDRAETYFRESLANYTRVYPDTHPRVLDVVSNLGAVYLYQYRLDLAEQTFRDLLERRIEAVGRETVDVADALNGLGVVLARQGRFAEAEDVIRQSIDLAARVLGSGHWQVANDERNLAMILQRQGRLAEAVPLMIQAYEKFRAAPDRLDGVHFMRAQLGYLWTRTGRVREGMQAMRESLREIAAVHSAGHEYVADTQVLLGQALLRTTSPRDAEPLFRDALQFRLSSMSESHVLVAEARCGLAAALAAGGRQADAAPLFAHCFATYEQWGFADPAEVEHVRVHMEPALSP